MLLLGVIQAQAAGAAPALAGSFDLLQSEVLGSSQASVTFSNLGDYAADYQHLQIRGVVARTSTGDTANAFVKLNGSNATKAHMLTGYGSGSPVSSVPTSPRTWIFSGTGNIYTAFVLDILDFSSSSKNKTTRMLSGSATSESMIQLTSSFLDSTSAVSSVSIGADGTTFQANSRFSLYGWKAQ